MTPAEIINYKAKVASRYLVVDPEHIGEKIMEADYYLASVKHDGFFGILVVKDGTPTLYGRSGDVLDVPQITKAAAALKKNMVLAGEICAFKDGVSGTHHNVSSAIADPLKNDLRFGVFDIVTHEGNPPPADPREKYDLLKSIAGTAKELFCIEQQVFTGRKDIISFYHETIKHAEGVVVRSGNGITYKIKPIITLDMVVMGYAEASGERAGLLRDLLLGLADESGGLQLVAKVGNGFSAKDRETLITMLEPMKVPSEYTEVSGAKTAFNMIKPELVVEISCLDLINESSTGAITKPMLDYSDANGYTVRGMHSTLSVLAPSLLRFRKDKKAVAQDAGYAQVAHYITPLAEEPHEHENVESTIVKREVYIKAGKDGTAVRKITALKTNKEETGKYPPYLVVYTDFSAGRKSPLDQDLYICHDEAAVVKKMDEVREENVKKGWKLF